MRITRLLVLVFVESTESAEFAAPALPVVTLDDAEAADDSVLDLYAVLHLLVVLLVVLALL
ncbi:MULTISPECIES: hypothetical protein, partial [unclassified Streptomyces]|uniref:hypothetical protein n=1 Tax=unclassified Streptomyces TaxID=2593676 RepID=UPI0035DB3882